jgi:ABC-type dipeptide/oligopeptide/nickel transport system permease subunit
MDKTRTIDAKKSAKESTYQGGPQQYVSNKYGQKRDLKQRYKDLWRARIKNKNLYRGFGASYMTGLLFVILASWGLPTFTFILSATSLFVLGSIIGSVVSGYTYDFDSFLGFHIGLLSSIPMLILYTVMIAIVNPFSLTYILPLLIINMVTAGMGTYIYTKIGRDKRKN